MFFSLSKVSIIKFSVAAAAAILAAFGLAGLGPSERNASASASGPSPTFTGAPYIVGCTSCPVENNCTSCHTGSGTNTGPGSITISGLPINYRPGQQIPLTVTLTDPNAVIYGFQLVAIKNNGDNAGLFDFPNLNPQPLQLVSGFINGFERRYLEHTASGVTPAQLDFHRWNFTWTAPAERVGRIGFYVAGNGANSDSGTSGDNIYLSSKAAVSGTAIANFDSDTRSDISVYRPSTGTWYWLTSATPGYQFSQFGEPGDIAAPGDYDGDGKTDRVVFRPTTGTWYQLTSGGAYNVIPFGAQGDIPVPGDYDGDGKFDLAVWRPTNGTWYFLGSTGVYRFRQFGVNGDKPAQGDYDADGITDFVVFRPSTGTWYFQLTKVPSYSFTQFGVNGDLPVPGDYDGDGKVDMAVFRPSNGTWYMVNATQGYFVYPFGQNGDRPTPADFDGDGKTDLAVFRSGIWYILGTEGPTYTVYPFGQAGDTPVASGYIQQ